MENKMQAEDFTLERNYDVEGFRKFIDFLRSEHGCPWDRVQTHESLRQNCLEEAYEVCEAIDEKNPEHLKEELGDLLMQVLFHCSIEEQKGSFTLDDVCDAAVKKLIRRHPHVFAEENYHSMGEFLNAWEENKRTEHGQKSTADAIDGVARTLPSTWRCDKIIRKAEKDGWNNFGDFMELAGKLDMAAQKGDAEELEILYPKMMFALLARMNHSINTEIVLQKACDNFAKQFRQREEGEETHEAG
jgi:tetrapyrrole methylase family protein/MazG family protein